VFSPAARVSITISLWFVKAKGSIVQVRKLGYEPWRGGIGVRCENPHVTCTRETDLAKFPSRTLGDFVVKATGVIGSGMLMHAATGGVCKPTYFVDGMAWDRREPPIDYPGGIGKSGAYATSDVVAIEVYETGVLRPPRFSGDPRCGAIVIWTK
jgi:hypothetical protein